MGIGSVISIGYAGVKKIQKNTEQKIMVKEMKELFKKISKSLAKLRMLDKNYTGGNTLPRLMSQKQEIEAMLDNKRIIGQNDKNVDPRELVYPNGTPKLEITEEEFRKLSVKNIRDLYKIYRILEIYLNSVIEAVNNKLEGLKSTAEIKKLKKAINELKKLKRDCEELLKSLKKLVNRFIKFNKSSNINNSSKNHEVKTNNKKPGTIEDEDEDEDDGEIGDKGEDDEKSE